MRPYRFVGRWVDLDTIQSINEPMLDQYGNVYIQWQHAFRDTPDSVNFGRMTMPDEKKMAGKSLQEWQAERRRLEEQWEREGTAMYYKEAFVPFFTAWCGKHPKEVLCTSQQS
jgi:hypothetical protein